MVSVSGKVSRSANQRAIAASYAAVAANARAASARRVSSESSPAVAQLLEHGLVVLRPADGRAVGEVLRRAAQHRGTADVDELDRLLLGDAVTRDRRLERVEVHADEVERLDRLLLERAHVLLDVASRQDPRVHARVERLHPPAEHLRERREALDADHLEADVLEQPGRAPARDELDVERREPARERREPRLVVRRDQRPHATDLAFEVERHAARQEPVLDRLDARSHACRRCRSRRSPREPAR